MSMNEKQIAYQKALAKYIPEAFVVYVSNLLTQHKVRFKIVPPRSTKLGDFRPGNQFRLPQITVNGNLNPYSFLITTLHEFAHHITFQKYANRVSPHGSEWKYEFKLLLQPIIYHTEFPENIRVALEKSLHNLKASSCSDVHLSRELATFDSDMDTLLLLENLPQGTRFLLQNKIFYKGELRRKRFLCTEIRSNKNYLVSPIAKVKITEI
jgi:predicted SprT family Zn-dependent metalloprotease